MANVDAGAALPDATAGAVEPSGKAGSAVATGDAGAYKNLDLILDIPMQVSVRMGSTRMLVRELLQLGQGSVIELDKLAGEPMEVLVNNKLVARGEVVVVNEKFGIRLTDVVSTAERIQQLT
jgi:flagellar motor switch protein FliN/FliY